eukprot:Nitzschia sp. Nitz4//scaffold24_size164493//121820//122899//NITZ4_002343-RA/size164493-processed-gene-0.209-mRNA-1//1//CDS//3329544159//7169//frame0
MATPNDPSDLVRNPPSVIVKVQNTSQESVNGTLGIVVQYLPDRARYVVHMTESQQTVSFKPENLVKASMFEQAKAQYQQLTKDANLRREITNYYNLAASKLPPGVKPEYAAGGFGLFLLLAMYFVGFTRVLMFLSMIIMLGLIVAPDLVAHGNIPNWRILANNFPMRCRQTIEQSIPMARGRLSDKVAAGIILFFLATTFMSAVMPAKKPVPKAPMPPPVTPLSTGTSSAGGILTAKSIEEAYKFGFDDATAGNAFGTSMPAAPTTTIPQTSTSSYSDPDDYYVPHSYPPPSFGKPWYSKIGMWQVMAAMNIGRTLWELGRDAHGVFSPQLAIARLQTAQPMQLGMLAFSVYNIVRVFF